MAAHPEASEPDEARRQRQRRIHDQVRGIYASLGGTSLLVLIALVGVRPLDETLTIALCCFAAALPLSVIGFVAAHPASCLSFVAILLDGAAAAVGIGATLWHISATATVVFAATLLAAILLLLVFPQADLPARAADAGSSGRDRDAVILASTGRRHAADESRRTAPGRSDTPRA